MIPQIGAKPLAAKIDAGEPVFLLDVRQRWEHEIASIPGSVLIPLSELGGRLGEIEPPDNALIVVYCHHGIRSMAGVEFLQKRGFKSVASLTGGIDAWAVEMEPEMPRY
jgi:rhodanese-related sulfurtransferase